MEETSLLSLAAGCTNDSGVAVFLLLLNIFRIVLLSLKEEMEGMRIKQLVACSMQYRGSERLNY